MINNMCMSLITFKVRRKVSRPVHSRSGKLEPIGLHYGRGTLRVLGMGRLHSRAGMGTAEWPISYTMYKLGVRKLNIAGTLAGGSLRPSTFDG